MLSQDSGHSDSLIMTNILAEEPDVPVPTPTTGAGDDGASDASSEINVYELLNEEQVAEVSCLQQLVVQKKAVVLCIYPSTILWQRFSAWNLTGWSCYEPCDSSRRRLGACVV